LNLNLNKYSNLNLNKLGLKTKVKGNFIYKSINRQIIANIKSNFDEKGFLAFKFNKKLNQDFLKLDLFSRGLDLQNSEYIIGIEKLVLKKEILNLTLNLINYQMKHFAKEDFL